MKRFAAITLAVLLLGFTALIERTVAQDMQGLAKSAFKKILSEADKNHDGKLSRDEHLEMFTDREKAEKNFKLWDQNKDGFVTEQEYVKAVIEMGKQQPKK